MALCVNLQGVVPVLCQLLKRADFVHWQPSIVSNPILCEMDMKWRESVARNGRGVGAKLNVAQL